LKIAIIDEDLSPRTGSRRFTFEVASELRKRGHEVGLFTTNLDSRSCFDAYLSLPVHLFSKSPDNQSLAGRSLGLMRRHSNLMVTFATFWIYWLRQVDLVMDMSRKIADSQYDVVMLQYHGEHWLMPYFYYLNKASAIVFMNVTRRIRSSWELPFHRLQQLPLRREMTDKLLLLPPIGMWERISNGQIRSLLAPSQHLLGQVERQGMLGKRKGAVVPLGVNHSEFSSTGEEEEFALYVGRIHPHKSLELAITAMKGVSQGKYLVIAGDLTSDFLWYKEKLIRIARRIGVADKIEIIESPSDAGIVRLMQRCSAFLFPSTIDTFGLVVLEAMACGKPIIACNRGGVPEVVGDAGFLLEPDVRQWQKTVHRVLSDIELRSVMGAKSLSRSKRFSWEKTTDKLLSVLRDGTETA
jgi:glycosyltransferase involved in cell wall biosynthesis